MSLKGVFDLIAEINKRPDVVNIIVTTTKDLEDMNDSLMFQHFSEMASRINEVQHEPA
jgi:hypothetical protein